MFVRRDPEAVVIGTGSRFLKGNAGETGDRPDAVDSLVVVAEQAQVAALTSDVGRLHYYAQHFLLDVEVIAQHPAALEIRVDGADRRSAAGWDGERIREVDIAGVVHR